MLTYPPCSGVFWQTTDPDLEGEKVNGGKHAVESALQLLEDAEKRSKDELEEFVENVSQRMRTTVDGTCVVSLACDRTNSYSVAFTRQHVVPPAAVYLLLFVHACDRYVAMVVSSSMNYPRLIRLVCRLCGIATATLCPGTFRTSRRAREDETQGRACTRHG